MALANYSRTTLEDLMSDKIFVIDTSVFLADSECINSYEDNDIIIPLKVLEEIDRHKGRQDGPGLNARSIIRKLDQLRESGNLNCGVSLAIDKGKVYARSFDPTVLSEDFPLSNPDNQIIATALTEREITDKEVVVVTRDINLRVKCDALGVATEDYNEQYVVEQPESIYSGVIHVTTSDDNIENFYKGESVHIDGNFNPNQFIVLASEVEEKKTALARYTSSHEPLKRIVNLNSNVWGLRPRNKEQSFAMDLLLDPEIKVVSLIGQAGCGKTLLALAAGLEQVLEQKIYKKLIVSRPVHPLGTQDIGYLPGTIEEKMAPWLAPIQDNLQFLMNDDKIAMSMYQEQGKIEVEALSFIRGRTISNAYIIIDEAQNLTPHEMKTIITRVGENTKIVLTGDVEQIDHVYVDATSNGLTVAVEKFKEYGITGHITLKRGERSEVASMAVEAL